jgi:hypothetical protein
LEHIANWREDLSEHIARAVLIFELADVDVDLDQLKEEVAKFVRVRSLAWRVAT